jgi:transposase InsO family protein
VDHFTDYIWLYPSKAKSDVYSIFPTFQKLVENTFNFKIQSIYTDEGEEYIALKKYFQSYGINHLQTSPHTPQHNGAAERRHRHLVETGLALLHTTSPSSFWSFAFQTTAYLINRLPTPLFNFS